MVEELLKLTGAGAAGAAIAVVVLFVKGYVVPGYMYREQKERADKNENKLHEVWGQIGTAQSVAEKGLEAVKEGTPK